MTDPIADMLIRIKNAQAVRKGAVSFGYSKIKFEIAKLLERAGYAGQVEQRGKKNAKLIEMKLLYEEDGAPKVSGARRASKPSRRFYRGHREIYPPRGGFGIAVYSTPKGLMTNKEAKRAKLGGEVLFEIW
ncbi:MAG: 30S ribosomal protein S8 [Candidatus Giovannonibacteria bacterium]|nr:MAG: 30S ribosomal protein S8 [Candidatus Giovannonibacteria bacterium]